MDDNRPKKTVHENMEEMSAAANVVGEIGKMFALPFVRRYFGRQGMGLQGAIAMVILFLLAVGAGSVPLAQFLFLWLAAVFFRRVESHRAMKRGLHQHSCSQGYPWLAMKFVRDQHKALWFEPFLVGLIGMALTAWSIHVGGLVMFSGFCLLGCHMAREHALNVGVQRRFDAEMEAREMNGRFHDRFNKK